MLEHAKACARVDASGVAVGLGDDRDALGTAGERCTCCRREQRAREAAPAIRRVRLHVLIAADVADQRDAEARDELRAVERAEELRGAADDEIAMPRRATL